VVENSFGILASKWRVFQNEISGNVNHVIGYIKAAVVLHNFLIYTNENTSLTQADYHNYLNPSQVVDQSQFQDFTSIGSNFASSLAFDVRENFANYFSSEIGSLSWQQNYVNRGL